MLWSIKRYAISKEGSLAVALCTHCWSMVLIIKKSMVRVVGLTGSFHSSGTFFSHSIMIRRKCFVSIQQISSIYMYFLVDSHQCLTTRLLIVLCKIRDFQWATLQVNMNLKWQLSLPLFLKRTHLCPKSLKNFFLII